MPDAPALLRRLARFRGDYSRRAYSLDAGDIEIVLGMGRRIEELEAALLWYADHANWTETDDDGYGDGMNSPPRPRRIAKDLGHRARVALGEEK